MDIGFHDVSCRIAFFHQVFALCYLYATSETINEIRQLIDGVLTMPTLRLTARTIDSLKADPTRQIDYFDESLPGFAVRVSKYGKRSWCVIYRHANKVRRFTLGTYPTTSLADARDKARDALHDVQSGIDPAAKKKADRQAETFTELADDFMDRYSKKKKKSWAEDQRIIDNYLKPKFRHAFAKDVTRAQVRQMLEEIAERAPIQANRVLAVIRKMYRWGLDQDLVQTSPCFAISAPGQERQRERILSEEEIKRIWKAFNDDDTAMAAAMKLRLITAQRGGEVISMAWSEVDFASRWWTIPAEKSKNGLSHRVWLSAPALRILRELEKKRDQNDRLKKSPLIFPNPRDGSQPMRELQKCIQRIRAFSQVEDFNGHDLRRTAASMMTSVGVPRLVVQKILNHVETGVTAVYDRHSYDAEKKDALDKWAKRLMRMVSNLKAATASAAVRA